MKKGFTLIELLVVVSISIIMSALAITYSKVGQNQVALSVEEAKLSQLILRAKQLSLSTYGIAQGACGYGIVVNIPQQTYSLYAYVPAGSGGTCPQIGTITGISANDMKQYENGSWNIHVATGVMIQGSAPANDLLKNVLFYPPAPTTFLSRDGSNFLAPGQTSRVYLKTVDGSAATVISVNPAGQVAF